MGTVAFGTGLKGIDEVFREADRNFALSLLAMGFTVLRKIVIDS